MASATTFITAFTAVFGTAEAIRGSQASSKRDEHRQRKNNLIVHCPKSSQYSPNLEGRHVVLSGDKVRAGASIYCFPHLPEAPGGLRLLPPSTIELPD